MNAIAPMPAESERRGAPKSNQRSELSTCEKETFGPTICTIIWHSSYGRLRWKFQ